MTDEDILLAQIFQQIWKDKYPVTWCGQCDCASISCPDCKNGSCSGGGCEKCKEDFEEFHKSKTRVECYLTKEEKDVYWKCLEIQKFMLKAFGKNKSQIDFKQLDKDDKLSSRSRELFKDFL